MELKIGQCRVHPMSSDCQGSLPDCMVTWPVGALPMEAGRHRAGEEELLQLPCLPPEEHELEFFIDVTGHPTMVKCTCGRESKVEMA